jgi:hypothetical protein
VAEERSDECDVGCNDWLGIMRAILWDLLKSGWEKRGRWYW